MFGTGFAPFRGGPMHYLEHGSGDIHREILARIGEES